MLAPCFAQLHQSFAHICDGHEFDGRGHGFVALVLMVMLMM
jgi:hypothetical protein